MKISLKTSKDPGTVELVNGQTVITPNASIRKIKDALEKVNGKATAHTFTSFTQIQRLVEIAEKQLETLNLPKKHWTGARFEATSGEPVPKKYKYQRIATRVVLERGANHWFLIWAGRDYIHASGGEMFLRLSQAQDAEIVSALRRSYRRFNV